MPASDEAVEAAAKVLEELSPYKQDVRRALEAAHKVEGEGLTSSVEMEIFETVCHERDVAEEKLREGEGALRDLQAIVDRQAEDEGLWFIAPDAATAYVQQELRKLHAAIESLSKLNEEAEAGG